MGRGKLGIGKMIGSKATSFKKSFGAMKGDIRDRFRANHPLDPFAGSAPVVDAAPGTSSNSSMDIVSRMIEHLLKSRLILRALVYIGAVALVLAILFVLSYYAYPRLPYLCRAIDIDVEFERIFKKQVIPIVERFAGTGRRRSAPAPAPSPSPASSTTLKDVLVARVTAQVEDISGTLKSMVSDAPKKKLKMGVEADVQEIAVIDRVIAASRNLIAADVDYDDWVFFYMFREYLLKGTEDAMWIFTQFDGNVIHKMAPESIVKLLCSTPNKLPDQARLNAYVAGPFAAIETFQKAIAGAASNLKAFRRRLTDLNVLKDALDIFYLNFAINSYEKTIVRCWNMRRTHGFTFQLNILKVYFTPITRYIMQHQIRENVWSGFDKKVLKFKDTLIAGFKSIEKAFDDKRKQLLSESFDTHEGFIDVIIGFIQFLFQLLQMIFMFIKKLSQFVSDPLSFFAWVIQVIALIFIGIWLKIFGIFFVTLWVYPLAFLLVLLWCVLLTVMWLVIYAAMMIQMIVYTVVDMATGGLMLAVLRCENSLDSWALTPSHSDDNGYVRALLCFCPCSEGYVPRGPLCVAMKDLKSSFCPHQHIFSSCYYDALTEEKHKVSSSVDYNPSLGFWTEEDIKQKKELAKFYDALSLNMKGCKKKYAPYDPMIRTMCRNLKLLKTGKEEAFLKTLCDLTYCEFEDPPAEFCAPMPPSEPDPVSASNIIEWILRTATVVTLVMVFFVTIGIVTTRRLKK
jgi:hypothetical protein